MPNFCEKCGTQLVEGAKFCTQCGNTIENQTVPPPPPQQIPTSPGAGIWFQNNYKIRKKVIAVTNKYWIEDLNGNILGFSKQKMFKLKEDIRIFTDESQSNELFRIKQEQILDVWGTFGVIDSATNTKLGYIKRKFISKFGRDEWEIYDINNQLIGGIYESSWGRALARKYMPGGGLVPEKMTFELNGQPVAEINQDFKIIGDIWQMNILNVPQTLDRRVMISGMLLMGMIERDRK